MPASLAWSSPPRAPIFQVYGTKRKAEPQQEADQGMECGDAAQEAEAKRKCLWTERGQGDGPHVPAMMEGCLPAHGAHAQQQQQPMQPSPEKTWCSQVQQQQQVPRSPSPWPTAQQTNNNTISQQQQQQQQQRQQPAYIMNINDETYTGGSGGGSLEAEVAAMDSDFVPDSRQYAAPPPAAATAGQATAYCQQFCGVGDQSPTSGQIRCFCRPSWEGMMAMKPYVSDYY